MATIALDRIRHYQHHGGGGMPPTLQFQITASEAAKPAGNFWKIVNGLITSAAAGNTLIAGFTDKKTVAASATQALCPMIDLILLLPNIVYEASFETGAAAITVLGPKTAHTENATYGATIGAANAAGIFHPVAFFGAAPGSNFMFGFNQFIGKNATTVTAGNTTSGGIDDKGTVGDTTPRLLTLVSVLGSIVA